MEKKDILKDVVEFKQEFVQMMNDDELLPSIILEKYEIITLLSKSKRSEVYLIKSKKDYVKRVLKIHDTMFEENDSILKELSHSAIPSFVENHNIKGKTYLIREYFDGTTLADYIIQNGVFSSAKALNVIKDIIDILDYLHSRKTPIIYRDIKAENIIIDSQNNIKLIDFDISRKFDETSTKDTTCIGTKVYSPPEQYGYAQTDERSDIYAVGVLMMFLTTLSTDIKRIDMLDNKAFARIIDKCTAFSPKDRYNSVKELESDIIRAEKSKKSQLSLMLAFAFAAAGLLIGTVLGIALERYEVIPIFYNQNPDQIVEFESGIIEMAVREQLGKTNDEPIVMYELDEIEYLHIWGDKYFDDSQELMISYSPSFDNVYVYRDDYKEGNDTKLQRGQIKSIDDLKMFNNIRSLHLVYQNINDISALSHLNLEYLNTAGNYISDISPLADCSGIISLNLDGNPITDISALSDMIYLSELNASFTSVSDLSPLADLFRLKFLYINNAFVEDVTPLVNLKLENLFLENNNITDFSALPEINNLHIEGNE